ncbi:MAG: chain length determinant protein EpsF [Burkholderiales bacterium]
MSLSQYLSILQARWRSAVVVFILIVGLVAAFTLLLPRKYTASAAVVLDVKSPDPIAGVVLPGMTVSGYMATQIDVMQSERVALLALRALHLDKDPDLRAAWQEQTDGRGDFESWLAEDIARHLDAKPGKDSNVMVVSYNARNAEVAAKTANALVKAYIETTLQLRTEPAKQYNGMFDESTKVQREALEKAQARLSAFQQSKGIVATDEKYDIENARLSELSTQLGVMQATATESQGRQREASAKGDQMQEVLTNPMITTLSADLARQQARLNEIGQRLGDQHPEVQQLRANIEELRTRLNAERSRITGGITVNNSVNQSRLETVRSDLAAQRSKVLQLKGLRDEVTVLQRDVENAQKVYDAGFAKLNQSAVESQATQTNVSVLKNATTPPFPSSPRVGLNAAIALLLGVTLGLATAVLRERRDWRLRADADVFEVLNQPLLGVLPDNPDARLAGRPRSLRAVAERVLGRPPSLIGH